MSALHPLIAASVLGDIGSLIFQAIFAFALLLIAIWGQISQGNRALKMGQDIAFGFFALFVWFIGVSQMIAGQVSGLALVLVTILMGTALIDRVRAATWARLLPIEAESRMHMLGLVCLLFAVAVFFLASASVADPIGTPTDRASVYDPGQPRASSGIVWSGFDPLPAPRKNMGVVAVGSTLYVVGGDDANGPTSSVLAYDTALRDQPVAGRVPQWATKGPLPEPRANLAVAVLDGKIYAVGGERDGVPVAAAAVYDPATDTWGALPPLPEGRTDLAAAGANGKLYVLGGTTVAGTTPKRHGLTTVSVYDPATKQWSAAPAMPTARSGLATVALGNTIYALGGQQDGVSLKTAERFDPQTNAWSTLAPMREARRNLAATNRENTIYAAGGIGTAESSNTLQVLDIAANKWSSGPDLVAGSSGLGFVAVNGKLYTVGGAKDQLGQIVPHGGLVFTIGEALIVGALGIVFVGVGVRRTRKVAVEKAATARTTAANRGVIATSTAVEESGERFVGGVRFMWRRTPNELRARLGLDAPTPMTLLVAVVTAAVLVGVAIGGQWLTAQLSPTIAENVRRINDQALANIGGLGAAAVAAVLLGIGEELLFRGAIQPRYGVFLAALAFAALHTQYGFPLAPLTVFAVGIVLGIARRYTNTTAAILSHVLFVAAMVTLVATRAWTG
ncbi:MAG: CPBP family glutamic-type intramembrane protease [Chloroflexota bacterium]|nr:CPBP family glutamic-type intramembrane protease [Chloroflexota bacterium]